MASKAELRQEVWEAVTERDRREQRLGRLLMASPLTKALATGGFARFGDNTVVHYDAGVNWGAVDDALAALDAEREAEKRATQQDHGAAILAALRGFAASPTVRGEKGED